jgi:hypothetical protein
VSPCKELEDQLPASVLPQTAGVRVAVISTPRCGNTFLRHLLGQVYEARELAVHNPADIDWPALPPDCVLQIHWHRSPDFLSLLQRHRFHIVVLARHPLDVLLSILHYALHDDSSQRWLEGQTGSEAPIYGAMPCSCAFLQYATGARAAALLAVSRQWWDLPQAQKVHFERLVANPVQELDILLKGFGEPPRRSITDAVAANTLAKLRAHSDTQKVPEGDHHFWQGTPGLWKRLLPAEMAFAIAAAHAEVFSALGYVCDPDLLLDRAQADGTWVELTRPQLTHRLWNYRPLKLKLDQALSERRAFQEQFTELEALLKERNALLTAADQERAALHTAIERQRVEFQTALDHQRATLEAALADAHKTIQTLSAAPLQRMASLVKRLLRA